MLARNMHVERVAGHRHHVRPRPERDIAEHPRRDVPGRAERARLAHQPQRERGRDDIADHRDQPDDAVDAVADLGAGQDEGDVEQLCNRVEPRQPLLAGQIAERIARCRNRSENSGTATPSGFLRISRPSWSMTGPRGRARRKLAGNGSRDRAGVGSRSRRSTWPSDGNAKGGRKLRQAAAPAGRTLHSRNAASLPSPPMASARSGGGNSG